MQNICPRAPGDIMLFSGTLKKPKDPVEGAGRHPTLYFNTKPYKEERTMLLHFHP